MLRLAFTMWSFYYAVWVILHETSHVRQDEDLADLNLMNVQVAEDTFMDEDDESKCSNSHLWSCKKDKMYYAKQDHIFASSATGNVEDFKCTYESEDCSKILHDHIESTILNSELQTNIKCDNSQYWNVMNYSECPANESDLIYELYAPVCPTSTYVGIMLNQLQEFSTFHDSEIFTPITTQVLSNSLSHRLPSMKNSAPGELPPTLIIVLSIVVLLLFMALAHTCIHLCRMGKREASDSEMQELQSVD